MDRQISNFFISFNIYIMERRIKNKGNFKGGGRSLKPKLKETLQIKANVKRAVGEGSS